MGPRNRESSGRPSHQPTIAKHSRKLTFESDSCDAIFSRVHQDQVMRTTNEYDQGLDKRTNWIDRHLRMLDGALDGQYATEDARTWVVGEWAKSLYTMPGDSRTSGEDGYAATYIFRQAVEGRHSNAREWAFNMVGSELYRMAFPAQPSGAEDQSEQSGVESCGDVAEDGYESDSDGSTSEYENARRDVPVPEGGDLDGDYVNVKRRGDRRR